MHAPGHTAEHSAAHRLVFHAALAVARLGGALVIAVGILGMPQMGVLTRHLASVFATLSSASVIVAGITWLLGVQVFLHFFDRYLSRN